MTQMQPADLRWLDAAARIAMPYRGTSAENPTVGAIVVSPQGVMLGRGVTAPGGRPHAEPQAIAMAGSGVRGATLYVTLEPCNHWGRTPPCVEAVIAAGLARVVIGTGDFDPRTAGQSIAKMRAAGIDVVVADNHRPSLTLHEGFFSRIRRGRPFVTAKLAVSRDGMIGAPDRGNVAITGDTARRWTHMQRALSDAVMVGARTAVIDNPRLNVRLAGLEDRKPLRVVVTGRQALSSHLTLFATAMEQPVVLIGENIDLESMPQGVRVVESVSEAGRVNLADGLAKLGAMGVGSVLVEGGAGLNDALLDAGLVDRFCLLEGDGEAGPGGVMATVHGSLPQRLAELGFRVVDRQALGCDRRTTFERP